MVTKSSVAATISTLRDANDQAVADLRDLDDRRFEYESFAPDSNVQSWLYTHQVPEVLRWRLLDPYLRNIPLFLTGPSAIGKTDATRQGLQLAADDMGRPLDLHEMHVSQMMITDVAGIPRDDGKERTIWYPPKAFALKKALPEHQQCCEAFMEHFLATGETNYTLMQGNPLHAYFWDEVTNPATPSTVHQCFSLWYGNFVADHPLVDDAVHILAGNRSIDGTNSIDLARSAVTRVDQVLVVPSLAGWLVNYALTPVVIGDQETTREHPIVISYLHKNSGKFAPNTQSKEAMEAAPSPRGWSFVSKLLYANDRRPIPDELLKVQVVGHIGQAEANVLWSYRRYWDRMPDVNRLLNSEQQGDGPFGWLPESWPTDPSIIMMMLTQMAAKLNEKNASRFMTFMLDTEKFEPEWSGIGIKILKPMNKINKLGHEWATPQFAEWCMRFKEYML